ncbi:mitochondrial metalloendopeptidase OMA1-like [Typha angustifolia]|uniref:mitochondrial metalloendopeptidase OMA1-like n=1 Tax=Typha angustifolia TaxID=59011 RepID=UPI003C2BD4FB
MNFLKRARSPLSSLLFRSKTSAQLKPHPPPPLTRFRHSQPPLPYSQSSVFFSRRTYYVARQRPEVYHFRRGRGPHWYQNPRTVAIVVVSAGGAAVTIYYSNLESVPYTKRTHFVLLSPSVERQLGESQFQQLKSALAGKILPALHPDSVRVRLISQDIIRALQVGLRRQEEGHRWSDIDYANHQPGQLHPSHDDAAHEAILQLHGGGKKEGSVDEAWSSDDEILDDKWVHESRKEGEAKGSQVATRHLDRLNWEVLVVRDDTVNAFCLPGGKIVVFTGLLDHFRTDAEIATVIGHEVGHCVARHAAEMITKNLWFTILQVLVLQFVYMPDLINAMSNLLLRLPFSRRMEMEADHIGLLLLAAAGYDPRVAPMVYEKLGKITGDSALNNYLSTHPSSKKRAQLLSQGRAMEEALQIYGESLAGRGIEGFL